MEMRDFISRGSAAPLALLFTVVSMFFTTAYLKNSFSQTAMEKYRYTEWKALYAAEAGLNDVGIVVLPYITSDTLLLPGGVMYGKDEKNQPIGMYKDIACSTQLIPNTTRKEYKAYSTGVAEYIQQVEHLYRSKEESSLHFFLKVLKSLCILRMRKRPLVLEIRGQ